MLDIFDTVIMTDHLVIKHCAFETRNRNSWSEYRTNDAPTHHVKLQCDSPFTKFGTGAYKCNSFQCIVVDQVVRVPTLFG